MERKNKKQKFTGPDTGSSAPPGGMVKKKREVAPGGGGLERSGFNFPYCTAANLLN